MSKPKRYIWEFSFDLDMSSLKQVYPGNSPANSYRMIRNYLFRNGFSDNIRKQGSCYFTLKPMDKYSVTKIICDMYVRFPWLKYCTRRSELATVPQNIVNINNYIGDLITIDKQNNIHISDLPLDADQSQVAKSEKIQKPKTI